MRHERGKNEWRDLAVADSGGAVVLELEAKALYSFDVTNEGRRRDRRGIKPRDLLADHGTEVTRLRPAAARGETCFLLCGGMHAHATYRAEMVT